MHCTMVVSTYIEPPCHTAFIKFAEHDCNDFLHVTKSWSSLDSRNDSFRVPLQDLQRRSTSVSTDLEDQTPKAAEYGRIRLGFIAIGALLACFTVIILHSAF